MDIFLIGVWILTVSAFVNIYQSLYLRSVHFCHADFSSKKKKKKVYILEYNTIFKWIFTIKHSRNFKSELLAAPFGLLALTSDECEFIFFCCLVH